jgi:phosphoribosylaminoimidazolecarboxamide formyltransferase/IMP cyclohydrolase
MTASAIRRALLSVSDKTGLLEFARFLQENKVEILSTGGTARALKEAGIAVKEVSDYTGFPEIMDGRVKTLHPRVHGGLLGRRDDSAHLDAMQTHGIAPIDLVAITLYPFEETVAKGAGFEECVENIDIGGPGMIRSSAKNHAFVTVITDTKDYGRVMEEMRAHQGATTENLRRALALKAFQRTAAYDGAISRWLSGMEGEAFPALLPVTGTLAQALHYGENPHQKAAFYRDGSHGPSLASATLAQGERLSYNNINDASAAFELASEFAEPAVVIVKHANPCGVALGNTLAEAYAKAYACDKTSAYGGIIAVNRLVDEDFAKAIMPLFVEVLVAPGASEAAKAALAAKKKLRLLLTGGMADPKRARMAVRSVSGGYLFQDDDVHILPQEGLTYATQKKPSTFQETDLRFAFTVAKHVKSNAIVLVKDTATIGIGAGQMSRIDSTRIACRKAEEAGLPLSGAVLASDAFFPFSDNVEMAAEAGITAIIQPGGSMRDAEVIAAADARGIAMLFTGMRHFRH